MRTTLTAILVALALTSIPVRAAALGVADHEKITRRACVDAGLPRQLCLRAAAAAYNVDAREWDRPEAHSMTPAGQSLCEAAEATLERVRALGAELAERLRVVTADSWQDEGGLAGDTLGRALHTIHDNCAHHGMDDPQHAWTTSSDLCDDTDSSPDEQPEALACARRETAAIMAGLAPLIDELGNAEWIDATACPDPIENEGRGPRVPDPCNERALPSLGTACEFLRTADDWDGVDRRWDHAFMTDLISTAFLEALWGIGGEPFEVCLTGYIEEPMPRPQQDVSRGRAECTVTDLACIGGADAAGSEAALFGAEPTEPDAATAAGCGVTSRAPAPGPELLVVTLLAALACLRPRRRR